MHRLPCAAVIALFGCGAASQSGPIARVLSFGDSLSDVGSYAPIAAPVGGGKFTTNDGPIWIELVAQGYGLTLTPNVVGWNGLQAPENCPAPGCFAYGQGGSRVTDPDGINHENGALTLPVVTQLADHLKENGGAFLQTDLVFVLAGANDILYQAGVVAAMDETPQEATALVEQAAMDLAGDIGTIRQKGAGHVYVVTVPDFSNTPYGHSLDADGQQLVSGLVTAFNQTLKAQVTGVKWVDLAALLVDEQMSPTQYGLPAGVDTTKPACDPTKIAAVTGGQDMDGSSLFCSAYTLVAAGANEDYLFADGLHPTTAGHRAFAQVVQGQLRADGLL